MGVSVGANGGKTKREFLWLEMCWLREFVGRTR